MEFNSILAAVQLAVASLQLHLDHFKYTSRNSLQDDHNTLNLIELGEAIRSLEFALTETVAYTYNRRSRAPNERLSMLWENASNCLRRIRDCDELVGITFNKSMFWRNPTFMRDVDEDELRKISLENVLKQITPLRKKHDKLLSKIR